MLVTLRINDEKITISDNTAILKAARKTIIELLPANHTHDSSSHRFLLSGRPPYILRRRYA